MNQRERKRAHALGLTLIETVSIAGLITLLVLFTLALIPSFKLTNRRANMEAHGGMLAQSLLEEQRSIAFSKIGVEPPLPQTLDNILYTPEITVTENPPGLKEVRVTVRWTWKERTYTTFREAQLCDIPRG